MFPAAVHYHALVQPRLLVPLLAPHIDAAYSCCGQLFPDNSLERPQYYRFFPIAVLFLQFLRLQATYLSGSCLA